MLLAAPQPDSADTHTNNERKMRIRFMRGDATPPHCGVKCGFSSQQIILPLTQVSIAQPSHPVHA